MSEYVNLDDSVNWLCAHCHIPLRLMPVQIEYMGSGFPVELPRCPKCGMVYLPEALALGKMLEVEKALEDK